MIIRRARQTVNQNATSGLYQKIVALKSRTTKSVAASNALSPSLWMDQQFRNFSPVGAIRALGILKLHRAHDAPIPLSDEERHTLAGKTCPPTAGS